MKLLFIKATPKSTIDSYTMKAAYAFLESYKKANAVHDVTVVDLYREKMENLSRDILSELYYTADSPLQRYARQFAEADRYVFAAPMWTLSIPGILKTYLEYITLPGITFANTEKGPMGLLGGKGKKAIHITARGGIYSTGPAAEFEMGDRYLRTVLHFLGIECVDTLAIEGTNFFKGTDLDVRINESLSAADRIGKSF
ncbi:MAG TPA: NAD(P)H-dependent oxidoreductase [Spirochaetota bacterium]|nr:NAD(P)H-dependent oxidoreductase [Spirochaetota bacterium]HPU89156.1 NAD(P)H-dependent oxidoreductase [Spirochaetota bacterium]